MEDKIKIKQLAAREISDSRGNPTIEAEIFTEQGSFRASAPSGASTGKFEAVELRDENGKGVGKAIENIEKIIGPALINKEFENQKEIDDLMIELDGTPNKSKLGANAILAVSIAACRARAADRKIPLYQYVAELTEVGPLQVLPKPFFNIINGGAHVNNGLKLQEFIICPQSENFSENFGAGKKIYETLKEVLLQEFGEQGIGFGDEAGFVPPINKSEEALELLVKAIQKSGHNANVQIALDAAASQFYADGKYEIEPGKFVPSQELADFYIELAERYSIMSIEDPFAEEDYSAWKLLNPDLLKIGDDLTATNIDRIKMAKQEELINGVIIKPNQIGTVTEAIEAAKLAKSFGWKIAVSHRSGETIDDFISDFSVGVGANFIKAGAPAKPERLAKYERLLKIEEELENMKLET